MSGAPAGATAGVGTPRRRRHRPPPGRRFLSWLCWWVLLTGLWLWFDDTLLVADVVAGMVAAAIGASVAELAQAQADSHMRLRGVPLRPLLGLPLEVARDTVVVFSALAARVLRRRDPPSAFEEIPVQGGGDGAADATRRAVIVGTTSFAPNTFALGIDRPRRVMVVHRLVPKGRDA